TATKKTRRAGRSKKSTATVEEESTATEEVSAKSEDASSVTTAEPLEEAPVTKPADKEEDDLKKIEGIGPKVAEVLNEAGITTFAKLATSKAEDIKDILEKSGGN